MAGTFPGAVFRIGGPVALGPLATAGLPAGARGFAVPDRPGIRLPLEDVFACAQAESSELRIDGTEVQGLARTPCRPGDRASVSGKKKQNTIKTTTFRIGQGRTLSAAWLAEAQ